MAKFQNVSGFRQYVTINGKRTIVGNNRVFEKEEGFVQPGFKQVPDDTPVTVLEGASRLGRMKPIPDTLDQLQRKIEEMEQEAREATAKATDEDFDRINDQISEISSVSSEEIGKIKDIVDSMTMEMEETRTTQEKFEEQVKKRMEIIKVAINVIEGEMDQLYDKGILELPGDDEGN